MYDKIFIPMRIQPMHIGHLDLIKKSSTLSKNVIILIYNTKTQNENNPLSENDKIRTLKKTIEIEKLKNIKIISMPYFENPKKRFKFVDKNIQLTKDSLIISGNQFIINKFDILLGLKPQA